VVVTPYDEWLQTAVTYQKQILAEASSPSVLRWADTLVWLETQLQLPSEVHGQHEGGVVASWNVVKQLLPWVKEMSAGFVLARLTASVLRPLFEDIDYLPNPAVMLAIQAWWVDRLVVLHRETSNASIASAVFHRHHRSLSSMAMDEVDYAPFNYYSVHMALEAILTAIRDRLKELLHNAVADLHKEKAFWTMLLRAVQAVVDSPA